MQTPVPFLGTVTTGLLLLSASQSLAAESEYSRQQALEEVVVSADRGPKRRFDLAGNTSLLKRDEIELVGANHINEITARASGVWVSRGNGQEHLTAIRSPVLTGAGGCGAFAILENGIATRASGFCNANQLFDLMSESAGRIEILRGPASSVYGSNALHGAINVIDLPIDEQYRSLRLETGANEFARAHLVANGGKAHKYQLQLNLSRDGGYQEESGYDQQKVMFQHETETSGWLNRNRISASNLNQETAGFIQGFEAYEDNSLRRDNPNPEAFRDARSARASSHWVRNYGDGSETEVTPYARFNSMRFVQHWLAWKPVEENGHRSIGVQLQHSWQPNSKVSLKLGASAELTAAWLTETQDNPAPAFFRCPECLPVGSHYDYDVDAQQYAAFARSEWQLSERTRLDAGLQLESMRYDYDNKLGDGSACEEGVSPCRYFRPADANDRFTYASPAIAISHRLGSDDRLYAKVSRGTRAPQATELYRLQQGQIKADLDPVTLDSLEAGWRRHSDSYRFEINAFAMRKRNFIFQDSDRQVIDNGETEHSGVEFRVEVNLTDTLSAHINGTVARHRYGNNIEIASTNIRGKDIDTAPRQMGSVRVKWLPRPGDALELEWVHMGEYYLEPTNSHRYDGHNLAHLRYKMSLNTDWALGLRVHNLLDQDYAERADFGFGNYRYFVGLPRSAYLSVSRQF